MRLRVFSIGALILVIGAVAAWPALMAQAKDALERRLARETGRPWRIGQVSPSFRSTPGLILDDVRVGGGGDPEASIRRVRIAAPVGVLLGQAGSGEVVAEDVTLTLPPVRGPGGVATERASDPAASLRPSAIRLLIRGATVRPAASRDGLAVTIRTVELGADLAPGALPPTIRLDIDAADAKTVLEADRPGTDGTRPMRLTIEAASGPRIAATASVRVASEAVSLDAITGRIDRAPFSGSISVALDKKPRLAASLRLEALALSGDRPSMPPTVGAEVLAVTLPPDAIPDVAWFRPLDATVDLAIARLVLGPVAVTDVAVTARVKDGSLDAALVSARVYGGSARGRYVLGPDGEGAGRHQVGLSLTGVTVRPLLGDLLGIRGLDGTGTARLDLQATGGRASDLLGSAKGAGDFSVTDGRIDGLGLAQAAGFLGGSGRGGGLATRLDLVGGTVAIADGQAATNDLRLRTGLLDTEGVGSVDLVGRSLDIRLKPLKVVPGSGGRLDVPIRIAGPWSDPAVTADLSGLARDPAGAIQGLKDLGGGILGGGGPGGEEGGGLGGLLDAILPPAGPPRRTRP